MKFRSTRGDSEELRSAQAIIRGIAPDRGLYVPEEIPVMPFSLEEMEGASYQELAKRSRSMRQIMAEMVRSLSAR